MALLCFKNGSLTREYVRDKYAGGSWEEFNRLLMKTPPGNSGRIGMFFLVRLLFYDNQGTLLLTSFKLSGAGDYPSCTKSNL